MQKRERKEPVCTVFWLTKPLGLIYFISKIPDEAWGVLILWPQIVR